LLQLVITFAATIAFILGVFLR